MLDLDARKGYAGDTRGEDATIPITSEASDTAINSVVTHARGQIHFTISWAQLSLGVTVAICAHVRANLGRRRIGEACVFYWKVQAT